LGLIWRSEYDSGRDCITTSLIILFGQLKDKRIVLAKHVARIWVKRVICRASVEKPEEMRPLCDSGIDGEHNIKRDLKETGWVGLEWMYLAQGSGQT